MQKFYYDWEMDCIFFEKQMKVFHEANNEERSRAGEEPLTFAEYINNCLTCNNGCIDIIEAENFNDVVNKVDRMFKRKYYNKYGKLTDKQMTQLKRMAFEIAYQIYCK